MRRAGCALVVAACWLIGERAAAQAVDPRLVQPERPTVATHAGTVAPGYLEIEAGVQVDRLDGEQALSTPTVLKIGLASRVQLGIGLVALRPPSQSLGIGDLSAGVKWRILEGAPVLGDFAVQPALKLPTGSDARGLGTGTTDLSLLLISSHALGPVAMDLNVGYTRRSGDGRVAPRDATLWTASFGAPVAGPFGWVAEWFGYPRTTGPAGSVSTSALLTGPTALVRAWLALDAGIITPVSGPAPHSWYAGGVVNAGRVWGR